MLTVRKALLTDAPVLFALAERGYMESRYGRHPLRQEKFERLTQLATDQPDAVVVLVAVDGEEVVGFFCGIITEHYFADITYATNLALFVCPERRGTRAAVKLIKEFERLAIERGASEVLLGATSGIEPDRTVKLYNRLGYDTVGALTVKYIGD